MRRTIHLLAWSAVLALTIVSAGCYSTWVSSGLLYVEQGNYVKAEEMYRRALWYDEAEAAAHYHLAYTLAYRAENDHLANDEVDSARIKIAEAYEHYQLAAQYAPDVYGYNQDAENEEDRTPAENGIASMYARMYNNAVQYMNAERLDDALLYLDLAYLADPRGERAFDAVLLSSKLRFNEAASQEEVDEAELESILSKLTDLKVDDAWEQSGEKKADLAQTQAQVYRSLGRDEDAARLYEQLLADNPDDLGLIQRVAQIRVNQKDYESAGDLFARAVEISLDDPEIDNEDRFNMAYQAALAYREGELYERTAAMADRAWEFAGSSSQRSQLARAKARSFYELERWDDAIETLEAVVVDGGIDPNSLEAWQIYYLSLNKAGRTDEAQTARQRFIALRDGGGR